MSAFVEPSDPATGGRARRLALPVFHPDFMANAHTATHDELLHAAIENSVVKKDYVRREVLAELPDADGLRTVAGAIKRHTLDNLDFYLRQLEGNVIKAGGQVHFAATAEEANAIIIAIAKRTGSKLVVKSKSMVSEETLLNDALIEAGIEPVETDLGELIVQVGHDHPSHLVLPIIHLRRKEIGKVLCTFLNVPYTEDPPTLAEYARVYLRNRFNQADMGISGVNFAIAETGSIVMCTNEGNGRMCTTRPRVHVALMGMEKVIPRLADLPVFLKLLARSATGQPLTQYTNIVTGPRRAGELDGPEEFHLVILDNGRTRILGSRYRDTLRCIRCGACLNACPVYRKVGGHSYGSVYPGPIGALLTPLFNGLGGHKHLPHASSLCGACYEACPVKINIPEMLIELKEDMAKAHITPWWERAVFKLWTLALSRSFTYGLSQKMQQIGLRMLPASEGFIKRLPPPATGWTSVRDFPRPPKESFRTLYKNRQMSKK